MPLQQLRQRFLVLLWETDLDSLPDWQALLVFYLRIFSAVIRDIASGLPTLRAMSLVYTTLLSLVPLIAVSFSVLKGFGVHNQIEPLLMRFLQPLGPQGEQITSQIIQFVDNIKVGVLGSLGLALLIYTVISLVKKIEAAFNYTWRINTYRSITQRFTDYLSVIMVGPVLIFTAIGIAAAISRSSVLAALSGIEPFGALITLLGKLMPYLLIIGAFTFIYKVVPNTRVRFRSALAGAVVAGLLWETTGRLFALFVANSTSYTAVYSGFAVLIVFMIWLYVSWMILLTGASISYYHQHPERIVSRQTPLRLSCRLREKLALMVMQHIADSFHHNRSHWTIDDLTNALNAPNEALSRILDALQQAGLILTSGDKCDEYVPSRSLDRITLLDILDAVRAADESQDLNPNALTATPAVRDILQRLDDSRHQALQQKTLLDLIQP